MALTPGPMVLAAGDIADRDGEAARTAALLRGVPNATVLALGDNAYRCGSADDYEDHYATTWGEESLLARTRACPGNHEYGTFLCNEQGRGYFQFFADSHRDVWAAATKDYYSFAIANCRWHFVSLNSEITTELNSAQANWLRLNLESNRGKPILAFFHRPRFSSGHHGSQEDLQDLWNILRAFNAEIILNGHDHSYERFLQQNGQQQLDNQGITQFVIGTGGREHEQDQSRERNSAFAPVNELGVLKLVLNDTSYDWEFVAVSGRVVDSGLNLPVNIGHT